MIHLYPRFLSSKMALFAGCSVALVGCSAGSDSTPNTGDNSDGDMTPVVTSSGGNTANTPNQTPTNSSGGSAPSGSGGNPSTTPPPTTPPPSSGGTTSVPPVSCPGSDGETPLIDDLEDNDKAIQGHDNRNGRWAVYADGAGTLSESAGDVAPSDGEFCLEASGHDEWGANLLAYFREVRACYDASAYSGICFSARGEVTTDGEDDEVVDGTVVFAVSTSDTEADNKDALGEPLCTNCNNHFQVSIANADLDPEEYTEFCFDWTDFATDDESATTLSDVNQLWHVEWKLPAWSWEDVSHSVDGSICIDEVWFQD